MEYSYYLQLIDEDNPERGYEGIIEPVGMIPREKFAQLLVEEGLPTDAETVLAMCDAEQIAIASLMWEGWDVAAPVGVMETPWPDEKKMALLGGVLNGRAVASQKQLRQRMIEHGIPHTHGNVGAFFTAQEQVTMRLLADAYEVELPLGWISTVINGVFNSLEDTFDPERHVIDAKFEDSEINHCLTGYQELVNRKLTGPIRPLIDTCTNLNTNQDNGYVTPGQYLKIEGYFLRFQKTDPEQGVFFIAPDGQAYPMKVQVPPKLDYVVLTVPDDLPLGTYQLELRTILIPRDGLQKVTYPLSIVVTETESREK